MREVRVVRALVEYIAPLNDLSNEALEKKIVDAHNEQAVIHLHNVKVLGVGMKKVDVPAGGDA